ncbi:MAG: hypothetical protein ACTS6P_00480 [Candidatus Hodgkinia cicadicola]
MFSKFKTSVHLNLLRWIVYDLLKPNGLSIANSLCWIDGFVFIEIYFIAKLPRWDKKFISVLRWGNF